MLKFGFPVNCIPPLNNPGIPVNHKGATNFLVEVQKQLDAEVL